MIKLSSTFRQIINPIILLFSALVASGEAMAFGKTFVLFSPVVGTALINGEPASGIKIERHWKWGWNDQSDSDSTVTGSNGRFSFPIIEGSSLTAIFLPHQPDIRQIMTAHSHNGEVEIWVHDKSDYSLNSELKGRPLKVICHLDKEPSENDLYWGTCIEDNN